MRRRQDDEKEELDQMRREVEYLRTREEQKVDPVATGRTDKNGVDRLSGLRQPIKPE